MEAIATKGTAHSVDGGAARGTLKMRSHPLRSSSGLKGAANYCNHASFIGVGIGKGS